MSERNVLFMRALRCIKVLLCKYVPGRVNKDAWWMQMSHKWMQMLTGVNLSAKCPRPGWRFFCFSTNRLNCDLWAVLVGYLSYLVILVFYSKSLSQVPEHLGAVLLKFELSWKILSEEQRYFVGFPIFSSSLTSRFPHKSWQRGCVMRNCVINRAAGSRLIFRPDRSIVHPPSLSYQNK